MLNLNNMRYIFHSLFNLLLLTSTFAQSNKFQAGEILLKNGIQKTGYILGQFHLDAPKGVYFKPDEVTKSEYLEFSEIKEVRFGETLRYIPHCTQNTAQERCHWLKTLLIGKVSLHQSAADEGLYFMEEGGIFNGIRSPSFEGTLNLLKRKCEGFVVPANARFGTASLIQVVANYAKCKYPQEQVQSLQNAEETPAHWFIGPKVGANFGNASIFENHYYGRGAYQASPALTSGVALQLQIAPNWSASIEAVYFQRSFSADSVNVWPVVSPNYSKVNLDLAFLEIPFAGQYYFSKGKIAPYIQAGLHLGVPIKRSLAEEQFRANADELEDQPKNSFIGPAFGYGGGLGLKLQLSEKMTLQLSGQFTKFATTLSSSSKAFESSGFEDRTPIDMPRIQAGGVLFFRL